MLSERAEPIEQVRCLSSERSTPETSARLLQVIVVTASLLMITLSVNLQVPLYKTYALVAGYGNGLVAVTFAAYVIGLLPVLIMLGGISDRIGRKPVMLLGLITAFLANVFIILDPSMQTLFIVRILQGVAVGLSLGASTAFLAEILENPAQVTNAIGVVVTVGLGGGSLLTSTSLLYSNSSVPYSYYGVSIATMICCISMLFMPKEHHLHATRLIRLPLVSRNTIGYCVAIFLAWSLTGVIIATIPVELERLNLPGWSGLLVSLAIGTGVIFQPISHRLGPCRSLVAGYILLLLAYMVLLAGVWSGTLALILIGSAFSGASSFGLIYLAGLGAIVQSSGLEKARAVSGYFLFAYLGLGLPCIFIGYLADKSGLFSALVGFGSVLVGTAILFFVMKGQANSIRQE